MLVTYDGYMTFPGSAPLPQEQIEALASQFGLDVDVTCRAMEFEYAGRDTGRKIVTFLKALAPLVGQAEGEIACTLDLNDDGELKYEFYSIADGQLYCEVGTMVRSARKLVE